MVCQTQVDANCENPPQNAAVAIPLETLERDDHLIRIRICGRGHAGEKHQGLLRLALQNAKPLVVYAIHRARPGKLLLENRTDKKPGVARGKRLPYRNDIFD